MKYAFVLAVLLLAACSREPEALQLDLPVEPEKESVIESVQKMADVEIEKAEEPYRIWLTAQRSGVCERHHTRMLRRWIPVVYGLPAIGSFPEPDEAVDFPHGEEFLLGGCMVSPTKEREVYLCAECIAACRLWREEKKSRP